MRRLFQKVLAVLALTLTALVVALVLRPADLGLKAVSTIIRIQFPDVRQVTPDTLHGWLKDTSSPPPLLLDVRTEGEFNVSHLPGARRVPPEAGVTALSSLLESNRPVVAYCSVGYRSSELVDRLRRAGYTNLSNLEGSIFAWANEGFPIVDDMGARVSEVHPYNEFAVRLLKPPHRANASAIPLGPMEGLLHGLWQSKMVLSLVILFLLVAFETASPFFAFYRGRTKERVRSDIRNLVLGSANAMLVAAVFVGLWFWAARWAEHHGFGLLNWVRLTGWLHAVAAFVLLDLWMYWWHRWNHALPFFWRFHRVHHSDPHMDVTTASRFHFGEIMMSSALRVPVIVLLGVQLWEVVLYETIMFTIVQIHHANIGFPAWMERLLRRGLVTPGIHKVHHSDIPAETDSNYGAFSTLWDQCFGSFRPRPDLDKIKFGLKEVREARNLGFTGLLGLPVRRAPTQVSRSRSNTNDTEQEGHQ